jgi:hypothetical protein
MSEGLNKVTQRKKHIEILNHSNIYYHHQNSKLKIIIVQTILIQHIVL